MRILAHGISPELLQALGWTLLHFVWQGAALAALFVVTNALCRRATTRYALAVIALALMMAAPLITLAGLMRQKDPAVGYGAPGASALAVKPVEAVSVAAGPGAPSPEAPAPQPAGILWCVEAWFLGVLLLSLRTAGGLFLVEKMRRCEMRPVARELYEKCLALQRKMGLERVIRSEERRVGKECRCRWSLYHYKKKKMECRLQAYANMKETISGERPRYS